MFLFVPTVEYVFRFFFCFLISKTLSTFMFYLLQKPSLIYNIVIAIHGTYIIISSYFSVAIGYC